MGRKKIAIRGVLMTPKDGDKFYITDSELNPETGKYIYKKVTEKGDILETYPEHDTLKNANKQRASLVATLAEAIAGKKPGKKIVKERKKVETTTRDNQAGTVVQQLDMYQLVNDMILVGKGKTEIFQELQPRYNLTWEVFERVYSAGIEWYRARVVEQIDLPMVVHNHVNIYEKIYEFFDSINFSFGKNKTLQAKEKLLGYHKDESLFEVNQEEQVVIEVQQEYDINKLDDGEKVRLVDYLERIKVNKKEDTKND